MKLLVLSLFSFSFGAAHAMDKKFADIGKVKPITVSAASAGEASVPVSVYKGLHVQANPPSNPQLIATTLTVPAANGLEVGAPVYPPGKEYRSVATGEGAVMTYNGKFAIKLPVKIGSAKPGKYELAGELRYQACNDQTCFFPVKEKVAIPVVVK